MRDDLRRYLAREHKEGSPRISMYLPTSRSMPEVQTDPILFKNLLQQARSQLEEKYNVRVWKPMLSRLEKMQASAEFWRSNREGLAVLADETGEEVFRTELSFEPSVTVEEHFYLLPLLKALGSAAPAYLLDLSKDRFALYRVSQYDAEPIEQEAIVTSFDKLFDDTDSPGNLNFGSFSGSGNAFHAHRARPEEIAKERDKYFRYIDQELGNWAQRENLPVLLAGTRDNLSRFRSLAKGDFYLETQIDKPFDSIESGERRNLLQAILGPRREEKVEKLLEAYGQKASQGLLVGGIDNALPMAHFGRVDTLFIQDVKGAQERMKLNELTEKVLLSGGDVILLRNDALRGNVSATLRY